MTVVPYGLAQHLGDMAMKLRMTCILGFSLMPDE
jgi:hypothetical protein